MPKNQNLRKIDRDELRKERYRHLREMGFSPVEARRRRDTSGENIETFVEKERVRIRDIRADTRTERDRNIFQSIRKVRRRNQITVNKVDSAPRLKSQSARLVDFKNWSEAADFPDWAETYIKKQNRDRGLNRFDGYGYRRFYYRYVDGDSEDFIDEEGLADRDNSGVVDES